MTDWRVGDLAKAVGVKRSDYPDGPFNGTADGKVYRVIGVRMVGRDLGLELEGKPSRHWSNCWHHASFRKIRPDAHEACEAEFVTLLKRTKRKVEA